MTAGYNQTVSVTRYEYDPDDDVGGAMPTGTIILQDVNCRIEPIQPTMALLEQGLETVKLFRVHVDYRAKTIKENDELKVTRPKDSWYYLNSFRVLSVQHPSIKPSDPRGYIELVVRRRDEAHLVTS